MARRTRRIRRKAEEQVERLLDGSAEELAVLDQRVSGALGGLQDGADGWDYLTWSDRRRQHGEGIRKIYAETIRAEQADIQREKARWDRFANTTLLETLERMVPEEFVRRADVRDMMRSQLLALLEDGGPFELRCADDVALLVDAALPPPPPRTGFVELLLQSWSAAHPLTGSADEGEK